MRISDWSSDVCSSDLVELRGHRAVDAGELACGDLVAGAEEGAEQREACRPVHQVEAGADDDAHAEVADADGGPAPRTDVLAERSAERRVGRGGCSTGRERWSPYNVKKKKNTI